MKPILFFQLAALAVAVHATQCDGITPFQVPIRDVQIIPEIPNSYMKGVPATIGTPPQEIVLLPWPLVTSELNNTWIYDKRDCNPNVIQTDSKCRVWRGNYYQESISSTWVEASDITVAGGAPVEIQSQQGVDTGKLVASSLGGTDKLSFNTTGDLVDFPIGLPSGDWDNDLTMLHAMGMGTNSTVLNALLTTSRIGSRVWSIFWGRMWVADGDAIDGSIVFGGYDKQKTTGRGYTQPLDFSEKSGCWTGMKVVISNITLHYPLWGDVDLLDQSAQLMACIVPQHQLLLNGPTSLVENLAENTGLKPDNLSLGLHRGAYQFFNLSSSFDVDLTISLSTGLEIRIPNNQYLVPFVDINGNGSRVIDTSRRELLIGSLPNSMITTLGRYFLTGAYLMVDLDANTFTLWQANPTSDSKLVSRCGNATISNTGDSSGIIGGFLAGIVVGAIVAVVILCLGVLFCLRRIRRSLRGSQMPTEPPNPNSETSRLSELPVLDNAKPFSTQESELGGSPATVSEVSGQTNYTYEMDGSTLAGR